MPTKLIGSSGSNGPLMSNRKDLTWAALVPVVLIMVTAGILVKLHTRAASGAVLGESYMICDNTAQYLTSPWTYHALASGNQTYTVAQYEALSGYGSTLPPLPSY